MIAVKTDESVRNTYNVTKDRKSLKPILRFYLFFSLIFVGGAVLQILSIHIHIDIGSLATTREAHLN